MKSSYYNDRYLHTQKFSPTRRFLSILTEPVYKIPQDSPAFHIFSPTSSKQASAAFQWEYPLS